MAAVSAPEGSPCRSIASREPFFSASVCTVMFSGANSSTCSNVYWNPSKLSLGSPAIKSMFTMGMPACRTMA